MTIDLFAGMPVSDKDAAEAWYLQLWGGPPTFRPNDVEAGWEVAEHGYVYYELRPGRAGGGHVTLFVGDFEQRLETIGGRGLEPTSRGTYDNGVRHATFTDPDGNEISFGGAPPDDA